MPSAAEEIYFNSSFSTKYCIEDSSDYIFCIEKITIEDKSYDLGFYSKQEIIDKTIQTNFFIGIYDLRKIFHFYAGDFFLDWGSRVLLSGSGGSSTHGFSCASSENNIFSIRSDLNSSEKNFRGIALKISTGTPFLGAALSSAFSSREIFFSREEVQEKCSSSYFHSAFFRNNPDYKYNLTGNSYFFSFSTELKMLNYLSLGWLHLHADIIHDNSPLSADSGNSETPFTGYSGDSLYASYSDKFVTVFFEYAFPSNCDTTISNRCVKAAGFEYKNRCYKTNIYLQEKEENYYSPFSYIRGSHSAKRYIELENIFKMGNWTLKSQNESCEKEYSDLTLAYSFDNTFSGSYCSNNYTISAKWENDNELKDKCLTGNSISSYLKLKLHVLFNPTFTAMYNATDNHLEKLGFKNYAYPDKKLHYTVSCDYYPQNNVFRSALSISYSFKNFDFRFTETIEAEKNHLNYYRTYFSLSGEL